MTEKDKTQEILNQRGPVYGDFVNNAKMHRKLWDAIMHGLLLSGRTVSDLPPDTVTAADMIALKLSRLFTGDVNDLDGWDDIAGYARLIANRIRNERAVNNATMEIPPGWKKGNNGLWWEHLDGRIYYGDLISLRKYLGYDK